jgi:hypothetical protein
MNPMFLLGYLLNAGMFGGCAVTHSAGLTPSGRYSMIVECTFGAIAECTLETRHTCAVPVYTRDITNSNDWISEAFALAAHVRENDPKVLGPATRYATAREITRSWVNGGQCLDGRPDDQKRDGEKVCHE